MYIDLLQELEQGSTTKLAPMITQKVAAPSSIERYVHIILVLFIYQVLPGHSICTIRHSKRYSMYL